MDRVRRAIQPDVDHIVIPVHVYKLCMNVLDVSQMLPLEAIAGSSYRATIVLQCSPDCLAAAYHCSGKESIET